MELDRRQFLRAAGFSGIAVGLLEEGAYAIVNDDSFGVLVDIPNCIGCRKCEFACQKAAGFHTPSIDTFDDKSVFGEHRRPDPRSYTAVNRFENPGDIKSPVYVKANCLHCIEPACVSACLVGALQKEPEGPITYDAWKCIGCRYCMVACPFDIPAYDYQDAIAPQVRKCNFCFDRIRKSGGVPACVQICPRECLIFGKRRELIEVAHERIRSHPDQYIDHVYGETEAGGTSWMYLSSVPFEKIGFVPVSSDPPSRYTEKLQHSVFKFWLPPFALYGLLGLVHWLSRPNPPNANAQPESTSGEFGKEHGSPLPIHRNDEKDDGKDCK